MFNHPAVGERFFGRSSILALLEKRLEGLKEGYRQNIAILGQESIGKTSCLCQFLSSLDKQIIPIYLEIINEPFTHFACKFINILLYHFLKNKGLEPPEDLRLLIQESERFIPNLVEKIRQLKVDLEKNKFDEAYLKLLDLPALLSNETGRLCIVALDEFHKLEGLKLENPFLELGKKIMTQKNIMYMVTSSSINMAKNILSEKLSLLFGNFEIIYLEPFDFKASRGFLNQRLKEINISQNAKDFLIVFTGGNPFYLDLIGRELIREIGRLPSQEVSPEVIEQVLEYLIFNSWGVLNQYFTNYLLRLSNGRSWSNLISVLLSIANNTKIKDIAKAIRKRNQDVPKQMNRLIELGVVSKNGAFYRLTDKVFSFWLNFVYEKRDSSLELDGGKHLKAFKVEIERRISDFISNSKRDPVRIITDLFFAFRNELVEINHKQYRLPAFAEIKHCSFGNIKFYTLSKGSNVHWACAVVKDRETTETDLAVFSEHYKKAKPKIARKIIIALDGIEVNARLKALEDKMWVWDLQDLNLVLELYGKPQIVR